MPQMDPIVEKATRERINKPEAELTEADLAKVTRHWLTNTNVTDAGLKDVAKMRMLEMLCLSNTKITDAGLKEVSKLGRLTYLILHETQITDSGLKELAKMKQLTDLILVGTKVTSEGQSKLVEALPKCDIYY